MHKHQTRRYVVISNVTVVNIGVKIGVIGVNIGVTVVNTNIGDDPKGHPAVIICRVRG